MLKDGVDEPLRQRGQAEESSRYVRVYSARITGPQDQAGSVRSRLWSLFPATLLFPALARPDVRGQRVGRPIASSR